MPDVINPKQAAYTQNNLLRSMDKVNFLKLYCEIMNQLWIKCYLKYCLTYKTLYSCTITLPYLIVVSALVGARQQWVAAYSVNRVFCHTFLGLINLLRVNHL